MASALTSGAPTKEAHWLLSLLAALQQQHAGYHADPKGMAALGRVTIKFSWDDRNARFYGKLIDTLPGSGCVGGGVVAGLDPETLSVNEAASKIHGRVLAFLRSLST